MLLRSARLVFHGTPLVLVAIFTFGLLLAVQARIVGIPLALVLLSWFFKYCFVMLDAAIAGNDEPPVLSIEMVNPFDEQRPLGQGLLIAGGVALVLALRSHFGAGAAIATGAVLVLLLPANIAALGVSGNLFVAAWPPRLLAIVRGLGWHYFLLNAVTFAAAGGAYLLVTQGVALPLAIAGILILFLLIFVMIGGALFEHRIDFGLESRTPQERRDERDQRDHDRARQQMIDHSYEYFRHSKPVDGWREIQAWLTAHARGDRLLVEYHAVLEAACGWDDVRPGNKLANELIALLLAKRQTGAALEVVADRLATNPQFAPVEAARLAELAGLAGKRTLRRQIEAQGQSAAPP